MKKILLIPSLACCLFARISCPQTAVSSLSNAPDKKLADTPVAPRRTFLQWTEMKGMRTQIFVDLNTKAKIVYGGLNPQMSATLLLQLPGDGSAELLQYAGTGDDWKWTPVNAHPVLSHPSPGLDRVDFDYLPLASSNKLTVQFRSLDKDWKPVASSKVLPWQPS